MDMTWYWMDGWEWLGGHVIIISIIIPIFVVRVVVQSYFGRICDTAAEEQQQFVAVFVALHAVWPFHTTNIKR